MDHRQPAPNFTNAFLVSFGGVVFMMLIAIWAIWGMLAAVAISVAADKAIGKRGQRG